MPTGTPDKPGYLGTAVAGFLTPFLLLILGWMKYVRRDYFPFGDEFSLLVYSTRQFHPSLSSWFLKGFSSYFVVYPTWTLPYTNFLRPVANASYYFNSLLFGSRWSYFLLLTYAIHSGVVAVALCLARRRLKLPPAYALLIAILCFIAPTFGYSEFFFPSFAFDPFAALLVLLGIYYFLSDQLLLTWIFLTLAIFTKETALFAPLVVAILLFIRNRGGSYRRRSARAGLFLLPLAAWMLLRRLAFSSEIGAYPLAHTTVSGKLRNILLGVLSWPMGGAAPGMRPHSHYALYALNIAFWMITICGIFYAARFPPRGETAGGLIPRVGIGFGLASEESWVIVVFCAGSLLMPLCMHLEERFGSIFLPLLAMVLVCILRSAPSRWFRATALAAILLSTCVNLFLRAVNPNGLAFQRSLWKMSADYVGRISRSSASTLFTVDDIVGGHSSPDAIARFAGYRGNLVRINDLILVSWPACSLEPKIEIDQIEDQQLGITSKVSPACGIYNFNGADELPAEDRDRGRETASGRLIYRMHWRSGKMSVRLEGIPSNSAILMPQVGLHAYIEFPLIQGR